MTTTPALQALIDQWRSADLSWEGNVTDAFTRCAAALEHTLQRHPVVPCDVLSQLASEMLDTGHREVTNETCSQWLCETVAKYTPQPPNPHPQGTYLWAKEEHAHGKRVGRRSCPGAPGAKPDIPWAVCSFRDADFTATDWEVVS